MPCCNPYPPMNPWICNMPPPCNSGIASETAIFPVKPPSAPGPAWCTVGTNNLCCPSSILAVTPSNMNSTIGLPGYYNKLSVQVTPQAVAGCAYSATITVIIQGLPRNAAGITNSITIRCYEKTICFCNGCPATAEFVFMETFPAGTSPEPAYYFFNNDGSDAQFQVNIGVAFNGC